MVLQRFFDPVGGVRRVTIAKKKDPKDPAAMLSRGYGFVEFHNRDDAVKAMKTLQVAVT
jgi:RNA recognition motif-containing protein